jgi:hypothetical protein
MHQNFMRCLSAYAISKKKCFILQVVQQQAAVLGQ